MRQELKDRKRESIFHKRIRRRSRMIRLAAALVVFVTVYALILPALTLEKKLALQSPAIRLESADTGISTSKTILSCHFAGHEHSKSC